MAALAAAGTGINQDLSYLYERLLYKLSAEGLHDMWSVGSFLIIFIFCAIIITLTLVSVFNCCCGWCFEQRPRSAAAKVVALTPATSKGQMSVQMYTPPSHTQIQYYTSQSPEPTPVPLVEPERHVDPPPRPEPEPVKKTEKVKSKHVKAGSMRSRRGGRHHSVRKSTVGPM